MGDEYTVQLTDEDGNKFIFKVKAGSITFTNHNDEVITLDQLMTQIDDSMSEIENAKEYVDTGLHNLTGDFKYIFFSLADFEKYTKETISSKHTIFEHMPIKSEIRLNKNETTQLEWVVPDYISSKEYTIILEKIDENNIKGKITTIDNEYSYSYTISKNTDGYFIEGTWVNNWGNFASYDDNVIRDTSLVSLENTNVVNLRTTLTDDERNPFPASSDNVLPTIFDTKFREIYKGFPYEIIESVSANGQIPIRAIRISEPGIYTLDGRYTIVYSITDDEIFTTFLYVGNRQINDLIKCEFDNTLAISNIKYVNIPHTTFVVKPGEPVDIQLRYANNNTTEFENLNVTLFHMDITRIGNYYPSAINYT